MVRDRHRPGDLPWGWWLRVRDGVLEDEGGRTWRSVRDAFWQGELNFPDVHFAPEQHELLLRALSALDSPCADASEHRHDLFSGDMLFWRFYQCWLASSGMVDLSNRLGMQVSPLEGRLSDEGRSVLLMLRATRDPLWVDLPMAEIIAAVTSSAGTADEDARERVLKAFEASIGLRRHVFARERIGRSYAVTLTSMPAGHGARMPVRRVTWSMAFTDASTRDDLFAWLAARIDRWDAWGELAYRRGAPALSERLLTLILAGGVPST